MPLSIAVSVIVARLSVITTESVNNPDLLPSGVERLTVTRLGRPARKVLPEIMATMTCEKPVFEIVCLYDQGRAGFGRARRSPSYCGIDGVHPRDHISPVLT